MSRRATHYQVPDVFAGLVDPRLEGARCAGRSPLFDTEIDGESAESRSARLTWARGQCTACPVASACRTAAVEQDAPHGLWAGRVHGQRGRPHREGKAA